MRTAGEPGSCSHIEVSIDYADEGIEEKGREEILTSLKGIYAELSKLAAGYGRAAP